MLITAPYEKLRQSSTIICYVLKYVRNETDNALLLPPCNTLKAPSFKGKLAFLGPRARQNFPASRGEMSQIPYFPAITLFCYRSSSPDPTFLQKTRPKTFLQKTRPKNANSQGRDPLQTRSDIIAKRTAAEGRVRCGKATTRDVGLPECVWRRLCVSDCGASESVSI